MKDIVQDIWCHECQRNFRFNLPDDASGNLTIVCNHCGHEHYRVVTNGVITEDRWKSSQASWRIMGYSSTTSSASTYITLSVASSSTASFRLDAWRNTTSG